MFQIFQKKKLTASTIVPQSNKNNKSVIVTLHQTPHIQIPTTLLTECREITRNATKYRTQHGTGVYTRPPFCTKGYLNVDVDACFSAEKCRVLTKNILVARPKQMSTASSHQRTVPDQSYPVWMPGRHGYICLPRHIGMHLFGDAIYTPPSEVRCAVGGVIHAKFGGTLRDFQKRIVQHVITRFAACPIPRPCGGIIVASCGTGKTVMTIALICQLGLRAAIVVHKEFLLKQWSDRLAQFAPGIRVGVVQRDRVEVEGCDVVLFMIHSLARTDRYPPSTFAPFGIVIFDETHHISARTFITAAGMFPARLRLGLTATPVRANGLGYLLTWVLGPIVCEARRQDGATVTVQTITNNEPYRTIRTRFGDISYPGMVSQIVNDERRIQLVASLVANIVRQEKRRYVLVASDRLQHLHALMEATQQLLGDTCSMGLYVGATTKRDRLKRAENERICQILFTTFRMGEEGLDIPRMNTLVLASPKKQIEQLVGRITRGKSGKGGIDPVVYDIVDDNAGIFKSMALKRKRVYKRLGYCLQ